MEFFGIAITFLAWVLTYLGWKNGKWMKKAHEETQSLIQKNHEDIQNLIKSLHENTLKVLKEIANLIHEEHKKTRETLVQAKG